MATVHCAHSFVYPSIIARPSVRLSVSLILHDSLFLSHHSIFMCVAQSIFVPSFTIGFVRFACEYSLLVIVLSASKEAHHEMFQVYASVSSPCSLEERSCCIWLRRSIYRTRGQYVVKGTTVNGLYQTAKLTGTCTPPSRKVEPVSR